MSTNQLTHSYSALKMFENCPKRYHHQRVLKDVVDPGGLAAKHGEAVHKHLEDRLATKAPLPPTLSRAEKACQMVERFAAPGVVIPEKKFTITAEFEPTEWFSNQAWLRCAVDVLAMRGNKAFVADWKTGKRRPDFLQLRICAMMAMIHHEEINIVTAAFVWLKDDATDFEVYSRNDLPDLIDEVKQLTGRIDHALDVGIWPARPSGLCAFCPVAPQCEFKQVRR